MHTFGRPDTPLHFVIFPMVHLADATFYEEVTARLKTCDLVIAEGVTGNSARFRALTSTYRWARSNRSMDLTVQDIDPDRLGVPTVYPDVSAADLDRRWRQQVSRLTSLAVWLLMPVYAVGMRLFGTRRFIAKNVVMNDLPATREVLASERTQEILDVMIHQRDRPLVRALASVHTEYRHKPIEVGVLYGARHVPAAIRALHTLGYRHRTAEWLTVFTLDR